ncbi:hypothetical protein F7725_017663 [Dissostichus mawsoni]|uniref:Uncharacterized protein n=1 Tax=Dissostichus mawsoni TaxID=36200 RepID=A0A7J5Z5Q6_DISMA|nr:hypothetical protein F7725_017663 [Dissostichus mawsoni]
MYRGDIFAYPLFLQEKLSSRQITFFCMDVTCKYWPYLQKVAKSCPELQHLLNMKPFLSVFHAKAHDFKCEVRKHYQLIPFFLFEHITFFFVDLKSEMEWGVSGWGWITLGEEVEQCNAFLSRIAVTTKHMSKAALQNQLQNLETMKVQMAVTESKLEDWVNDVKEWAEAAKTTTNSNDADALASRIEVLVASIKRRSQRLYKDLDGSKGRARIRRKIRTEKGILTSVVESYNRMVVSTETILSGETAWPWQQLHSDSVDLKTKRKAFDIIMAIRRLQEENKIVVTEMDHHWKALKARADSLKELSCLLPNLPWSLSEEGLKGVQSIVFRKRQNIREMKTHTRAYYLQVLSGAENINFLQSALSEDFDSDSDSEID